MSKPSVLLSQNAPVIRLGGPVFKEYKSPDEWIAAVKELGYSAAYCPVTDTASQVDIAAYEKAALDNGIIIAEVGAWSNPLSSDENAKKLALTKCQTQLALADQVGARCCVNISGSRGEQWDGPDARNYSNETFDLIVETTRLIIDAVKPVRTFYTLEPMPWMYPDSVDSYLKLIKAIDRKQFGAHLDPVNMINSPERYYKNGEFIKDCFKRLGAHIKSCHAKDIILRPKLTTHLDEVAAGQGGLDYTAFLTGMAGLENIPLMLEHLETAQEYQVAAEYIRTVAKKNNLSCT